MNAQQKLTAHLIDLEREHAEAVAAEAWILAHALADCITQTRQQIEQVKTAAIDAHLAAMHQHNTATLTRWRQEVDARNSLNKSDAREIIKLHRFAGAGADLGMLARSLSALIRAARTNKSRDALMQYAPVFGVTNHPEFII